MAGLIARMLAQRGAQRVEPHFNAAGSSAPYPAFNRLRHADAVCAKSEEESFQGVGVRIGGQYARDRGAAREVLARLAQKRFVKLDDQILVRHLADSWLLRCTLRRRFSLALVR